MGKEKYFNENEFLKTYKVGEELTRFETSPFSEITDQEGIKFWLTHYNEITAIGGATGTAYAICERPLEPIKIYGYYLKIDANCFGTIIDIKDPQLKYHHVKNLDDVPSFLKDYISKLSKKGSNIVP